MHEAITWWVEKGLPHPSHMGDFLQSILSNDFMGAAMHADDMNAAALHGWAVVIMNDVPSAAWGSKAKLVAWHEAHKEARDAEAK
jgi:hypothetical protein